MLAGASMFDPRLRQQINSFVNGLFRFASQGLERYRKFKINAGFIDYGDQE